MNFGILENANELIKLIACCIVWLLESEKALGEKPSARRVCLISKLGSTYVR